MSGVGDITRSSGCVIRTFNEQFHNQLICLKQTASLSFDLIAVSILSLVSSSENFQNIFVISWFVWSSQNKSPLNLTGNHFLFFFIFFIVSSPSRRYRHEHLIIESPYRHEHLISLLWIWRESFFLLFQVHQDIYLI